MIGWIKSFFAREPGPWDIYIFPGGYVRTVKTRRRVELWMKMHALTFGERRAINRATKEHIVR